MRVLLVLEACGGGGARHVADLAGGLLAKNHEVSLIFSPQRAEAWFLDTISTLNRLDVHALPMDRSVTFSDIPRCLELRKLIDKTGPFDLLHGHSSKAGALIRLAQLGKRVPVVYTPHAPITMDPALPVLARTAYAFVERRLAALCERIICVSPAEKDHLQSMGFPEQKLRVVCNGIGAQPHQNRGKIRDTMGIDAGTVCFGFVGRITHQKAVDHALSAFAKVCREVNNARMVIIGDGPASVLDPAYLVVSPADAELDLVWSRFVPNLATVLFPHLPVIRHDDLFKQLRGLHELVYRVAGYPLTRW